MSGASGRNVRASMVKELRAAQNEIGGFMDALETHRQ